MIEEKDPKFLKSSKYQLDEIIKKMSTEDQKKANAYVKKYLEGAKKETWWFRP